MLAVLVHCVTWAVIRTTIREATPRVKAAMSAEAAGRASSSVAVSIGECVLESYKTPRNFKIYFSTVCFN